MLNYCTRYVNSISNSAAMTDGIVKLKTANLIIPSHIRINSEPDAILRTSHVIFCEFKN